MRLFKFLVVFAAFILAILAIRLLLNTLSATANKDQYAKTTETPSLEESYRLSAQNESRGLAFGPEDDFAKQLPQVLEFNRQVGGLERLSIDLNLLTLPAEIEQLTNLNVLKIENTQITFLPAAVGNLTSLEVLILRGNRLETLPSQIGSLINLTRLELEDNNLSELPAEIGNLTNLEVLDLRNNNLSNLPTEIVNLQKLSRLHLGGNNFPFVEKENIKNLLTNTQINF